jgi:hypothetical protein
MQILKVNKEVLRNMGVKTSGSRAVLRVSSARN